MTATDVGGDATTTAVSVATCDQPSDAAESAPVPPTAGAPDSLEAACAPMPAAAGAASTNAPVATVAHPTGSDSPTTGRTAVAFADPPAPVVDTTARAESPQTDTTSADIPLGPSGSSSPFHEAPSTTAGGGSTGCGAGGSGQGSAKGGSAPGAAVLGTPLGAPLALDDAALPEPAAGSPSGLPDDPTFLPD